MNPSYIAVNNTPLPSLSLPLSLSLSPPLPLSPSFSLCLSLTCSHIIIKYKLDVISLGAPHSGTQYLVEDDIGGVIVWGPSEGIVAPVGERVLAAWARRSEGLLIVAE